VQAVKHGRLSNWLGGLRWVNSLKGLLKMCPEGFLSLGEVCTKCFGSMWIISGMVTRGCSECLEYVQWVSKSVLNVSGMGTKDFLSVLEIVSKCPRCISNFYTMCPEGVVKSYWVCQIYMEILQIFSTRFPQFWGVSIKCSISICNISKICP